MHWQHTLVKKNCATAQQATEELRMKRPKASKSNVGKIV